MVIDRYSTRKLSQSTSNQFVAQFFSKATETTYQTPITLYRVIESSKKQDLTAGGRFQTKKQRNFRIYQSDLDFGLSVANLSFYPKTDDVIVPSWGAQYIITDATDKELHGQCWTIICQEAEGPVQLILNVVPPFATNWNQIITPTQWQNWSQPWGT